jgi:hypothetical protein
VPLAIASETISSLVLLVVSLSVLFGGALIAVRLSSANPSTIRVMFPLIALATLGCFALLTFISRLTR